ncbi:MAG: PhoP regulatory network YrbL family protein [Puniceicoccales bacterium]|nr:PhoP regulatory network YrbL family protein [Puniceicoccales bacterium]
MIKLKETLPIAIGGHCLVFTHPEIPSLVIKTINSAYVAKRKKSFSFHNLSFRRYKEYNDFYRYASGLAAAYAKAGTHLAFLQNFCQFVETDLGLGLVTEAERDETGAYAPTLRDLLHKGKFDEKVRAALETFFTDFLGSDVIISDLSANNIVYSYDRERRISRFVVIDGVGEKNAIPLCTWFRFFNKRAQSRAAKKIWKIVGQLTSQ